MKPLLRTVLTLTLGFVAGALIASFLWAQSLGAWHRVVQRQFAIEQELRATRAERRGDTLAALHHQWNAVDAQSDDWLHQFATWKTPGPWFPFQVYILDRIVPSGEAGQRGRQLANGIARGERARLLEVNRYADRAEAEWRIAAEMMGRYDVQRLRRFIASLQAQRASASELQSGAEDAVLGREPSSGGQKPPGVAK
jgi:hypothetical protein